MKSKRYSQLFLLPCLLVLASSAVEAKICTAKDKGEKSSITVCMEKVSAGDVILLEPGVYTDKANEGHEAFPIQMKPGVTLLGQGANNTRIVASNSHAFIGDSAGVRIEGVTIESNNGAAVYLTTMATADGIVIKDSDFISTGEYWFRSGVHVEHNTESVIIQGCNFTGPDWVVSIHPGTVAGISEVRIVDSSFTDNSDGKGEAPLGMSNILKLVMRNVEVSGWPWDTFQITASQVLIDNLDIADNSTFYIASMPGYTAQALIRNSRIGFNTSQTTHFRGNAETWVFNSQLNAPVTSAPPIELKLLNCYHKGLSPIDDI